MTKAREIFLKGKEILKNSGGEAYAFDASVLFEHFCKISRAELSFTDKQVQNENLFIESCEKRARGYPLQYIIGKWEFYGIEFTVNPNVLIPRADTETLIDYVLSHYSGKVSILDMCCGSGCIGLTLKKLLPDADVTLCDISEKALEVTRKNAEDLGLSVNIKQADLTKGGRYYFEDGSFDIIISNPPYITAEDMKKLSPEVRNEPKIALYGGTDGMDFYKSLAIDWKNTLKPCGEMIFESGYDTSDEIKTLFTELEYCDIKTRRDIGNIVRVVAAKRQEK